jgi:flavin-dependent dehydrogenase
VARTVGAATYIEEPPINFAFYTYIEDVGAGPDPEPMFEIWESERTGGTLMLAPCDAGISMTIVYLPQEGFDAFRSDKDGNFWKVMDCDPRVGPRLRAGTQVTPIRGAGDLSNFIRQPVGEGWALVGDAGQHKDPIFGQGIGDAVRSAEALADRLLEAESAGSDWGTALARYHVDRDLDLVPTFRWMIQGRAGGLSAQEFRSVLERTGSDPERSERFINIFSHAVSSSEYFGRLNTTELLGRDPASYNTRWSGSAPTGEVGG